VHADARPLTGVVAALIASESGDWVAACAARWAMDGAVALPPLLPSLTAALHSGFAPLREAAAMAVARAAPADAASLLAHLAQDPASFVARTARALIARPAPRATA
jgi:hypothetical protein